MKKKIVVLALSLVALAASAYSFNHEIRLVGVASATAVEKKRDGFAREAVRHAPDPARQQAGAGQHGSSGEGEAVPEEVMYGILFRQMTAMMRQAAKLERRGQDGSALRAHVKKEAKLKDEQARTLDRIALETEQEVARTDKEAAKVISEFRKRYPRGRLKDGEVLPPPPAELRALNEQRKNTILLARERLRNELGEGEFQRFDKFTKEKIGRKVKKLEAESTTNTASVVALGQRN